MFIEVDASGLNKAIAERVKFPGRTASEIVNNSAYFIARNAMQTTPFASIERIDTSLKVSTTYVISKRTGKVKRGKGGKIYSYGGGDEVKSVELAKLVVLARANLAGLNRKLGTGTVSNFNVSTGSRFALTKEDLKGGKAVIDELILKMVAGRHSSSKFIASGWGDALNAIGPVIGRRGAGRTSGYHGGNSPRGSGIPAVEGDWNCEAIIENATGLIGPNSANHNAALIRYGLAPLQAAVGNEEAAMLLRVEKEMEKKAEAFNRIAA